MLNRRQVLRTTAGITAMAFLPDAASAAEPPTALGVVIHSYGIRNGVSRERHETPLFGSPANFLEYCHTIGAAGIQIGLSGLSAEAAETLKTTAAKYGMYVEGSITAPKNADDVARFTADVQTAQRCGAEILRCAILNGRRYETFDTAAAWERQQAAAWQALQLAAPVVEKFGVRLAIENHKDYRADELVAVLKKLGSSHVGICLDTGNNWALLESAEETVAALAPFAFTTHLKDMAVAEYADGFLLAETPLGTGCLDLPKLLGVIRKANPRVRLNLEMITRDPLKIPCLTDKYWATFGNLRERVLTPALANVRKFASKTPLPQISRLSTAAQVQAEDDNVRHSLTYWREKLATT